MSDSEDYSVEDGDRSDEESEVLTAAMAANAADIAHRNVLEMHRSTTSFSTKIRAEFRFDNDSDNESDPGGDATQAAVNPMHGQLAEPAGGSTYKEKDYPSEPALVDIDLRQEPPPAAPSAAKKQDMPDSDDEYD